MPNRIKVLMSAYACEPGRGSEPEVGWQWAIHMAHHHDVTVITRANNREPIERELAALSGPHPDFLYFDLPGWLQAAKRRSLPLAAYYYFWQRAAAHQMSGRVRDFDLIHHVTFNSFRQPGAWRACGKPIVLGPLGGGQVCPWRLMTDFGPAWPGEMIRSLTVKMNWINPFARRSFRDAAVILCANADTAGRVPAAFQAKVRPMLETGVRDDSGLLQPVPHPPAAPHIIWVSRFVPIKGAPLALRAFAIALKQRPDLQLTMVGDGPDLSKARRMAVHLGVNASIHWAGKLPLAEVKALLPRKDIFLFTSLRDTSGNVLLEAMGAGLPAITLRHHGAAMIATDETAFRIPPASAAETSSRLADAMVRLAGDAGLRVRMGAAALRRIREIYVWPRKAEAMDAIYREALDPHPG